MNRVIKAERLVLELERMPQEGWRRLQRRPRFWLFMEEYWRAKCLSDFWWFLQYVGYHGQMKHYSVEAHGPQGIAGWLRRWRRPLCPKCGREVRWPSDACVPCGIAIDEATGIWVPLKWKLLATTRDGCKTQILSAYNAWEFARDVNLCLRICAFSDPRAREVGGTVMKLLEAPKYTRAFPWVQPEQKGNGTPSLWGPGALMLKRDDTAQRTPSMLATGIETSITGNHFHRGRYSDIETEDNCDSPEALNAAVEKMENDTSLYMGGAEKIIEGTTWSKLGPINGIIEGHERFREWETDIYYLPAEVRCFDGPFKCNDNASLDEDRVTLRTRAAMFPVEMGSLKLCQARATFFLAEAGQVVTEIREVEDNGADWVRVNRPFPAVFGQPRGFVIGETKPSMPHRHTLDAVDHKPPLSLQDSVHTRNSLVAQKKSLGPGKYSGQYLLKPVDETDLILNPARIKHVSLAETPQEGERWYFRAGDFASASKTRAASSLTTGFWHKTGLYLVRGFYRPTATLMEKLLELFVGQLWVASQRWGEEGKGQGILRNTTLEPAMVEKSVMEVYHDAKRDPHKFFMALGGQYAEAARYWFEKEGKSIGAVNVPFRHVTRTQNKNGRIALFEAPLENGQVHVVTDTYGPLEETVQFMEMFRMNSTTGLDLLENLQDLNECRPTFREAEKPAQEGSQLQAMLNQARMSRVLIHAGATGAGRAFRPYR